ncbi:MAG TPA: Gfo/Idh/MocA family oxidoreductase [Bryobacteraceae bacterium]|nr:Gfo/Idh/MocA family oxidoreductase [Bryobacteraceae bacterium]
MPVIMLLPFLFLAADLRLGIIGTDTSHATAFAQLLNSGKVPGAKIVAAYKGGSADVESSRTRVDNYAKELQTKWGVEIVNDIPTLAEKVDAILLLSVDGRTHLPQFRQALGAKKPVFIDKPLASTLADAREIDRFAREAHVPWFSASSLRWSEVVSSVEGLGILGAVTWGPGPFEEHHQLDLSWYAIHPIEILFTLMGPGCEEVTRISGADADEISCRWKNGRIGTVRALRPYGAYGAVVFRKDGVQVSPQKPHTDYEGLVREIVKFFETGKPPVSNADTLEIFAFMDAAQRSKEAGGKPMPLK